MTDMDKNQILNAVGKLGQKNGEKSREEISKIVESLSKQALDIGTLTSVWLLSVLARELLDAAVPYKGKVDEVGQ